MIGRIIRHDAALRYLGRWMFVGPLIMLTLLGVIAWAGFASLAAGGEAAAQRSLVILALWLPSAVYIAVNAGERRCSRFDMELPVSADTLWLGHGAALAIAGLALLAATAVILNVVGGLLSQLDSGFRRVLLLRSVPALTLKISPAVLLFVAMALCVEPGLARLPRGKKLLWSVIGATVVLSVLAVILGSLPVAAGLAPLALTAWLVIGARGRLPGSMLVARTEPSWFASAYVAATAHGGAASGDAGSSVGRATAGSEWSSDAGARRAQLATPRGTLRRTLSLIGVIEKNTTKMPLAPVVGVPILLAAGLAMSGVFGESSSGDDAIRFSLLFIISYSLLAFSGLPPRKLFTMDALPVSRRFIFAVVFLPFIALLSLGYAGGRVIADRSENARELICYCETEDCYRLSLPLRYGGIALDGNAPRVTAPWGESHDVWERRILSGGRAVVHSLYSTPSGSSLDFVAWQTSRAVQAVYGETIAPAEIAERYLKVDGEGNVVPRGGGLTLKADHPEWRVRPYGPVFPVMMLFVCGMWLVAFCLYLRTLNGRFTEKQRKGAFWWGMVVLMLLHVSQFVALFTNVTDYWLVAGTGMIAISSLAARLPGGAVSVWVLSGVGLFILYRVAERLFERVESNPGDDMRVSLIERPIGATTEDGAYAR